MVSRLAVIGSVAGLLAAATLVGERQTEARQEAAPSATQPAASAPGEAVPRTSRALSPRNASYSIDVRLDPDTKILTGRQVLTWRNISPVPASELHFHLYYNAWRNSESTWLREARSSGDLQLETLSPEDWGWIDVTGFTRLADGEMPAADLAAGLRYAAPDDGNEHDRTVMVVPLDAAVEPGETINLEIEWRAQVPRTFSRTGAIGDYFFLAQWFPKIGVLEADGWQCHQFHAATEFFADFGVYDVRITVPTGWTVGATGVQRELRENDDGTSTHRYFQADVHDFAWTTSPDYIERRERFQHPRLPGVEMRLLLQPEHVRQAGRHFAATRAALKFYGEWFGGYPYRQITIVDPAWQSGAGGMEYPTLFTAGTRWIAPEEVNQPESVTVHEAGHQFWYGVVATDEVNHAWMDEGLNTFSTARVLDEAFSPRYHAARFFGGFIPWVFTDLPVSRATDGNRLPGYRAAARMDDPSTPTFRYWPDTAAATSYDKTALWLHTLERHLGWDTLQRGLSQYFRRWRFRHPQPEDFFAAINDASGQDLSWFFDQVYRSAAVFDYGVQSLRSERSSVVGHVEENGTLRFADASDGDAYRTTVVARRYGDGVFPVDVLVRFDDGEAVRERWDGGEQWRAFVYERPARARDATVDPDRTLLLDVDYTNNSASLEPRGADAATKWSLRWMVWLQDLLLTYAFFV